MIIVKKLYKEIFVFLVFNYLYQTIYIHLHIDTHIFESSFIVILEYVYQYKGEHELLDKNG